MKKPNRKNKILPSVPCPCGQDRITTCGDLCMAFEKVYQPITEPRTLAVALELRRQEEETILLQARSIMARRHRIRTPRWRAVLAALGYGGQGTIE